MSKPITVEVSLHIEKGRRGTKQLADGKAPARPDLPAGKVPRIARLLALAHRFEAMLKAREAEDYADLARLGRVTRARLSQVMNLLLLAPDAQEAILFLPLTRKGRDPIKLALLQPICLEASWAEQRAMWEGLRADRGLAI